MGGTEITHFRRENWQLVGVTRKGEVVSVTAPGLVFLVIPPQVSRPTRQQQYWMAEEREKTTMGGRRPALDSWLASCESALPNDNEGRTEEVDMQ